jgi:hypothetical protein
MMNTEQRDGRNQTWSEELSVAGNQLVKTVQSLLREAVVRKIIVKDHTGRTLLEIPLYAGAAGMFFLGWWSAVLLIAAWFTEVSIYIERESETEPLVVEAADAVEKATAPPLLNEATERRRCQAITKSGEPCKRMAVSGSDFCAVHQPK